MEGVRQRPSDAVQLSKRARKRARGSQSVLVERSTTIIGIPSGDTQITQGPGKWNRNLWRRAKVVRKYFKGAEFVHETKTFEHVNSDEFRKPRSDHDFTSSLATPGRANHRGRFWISEESSPDHQVDKICNHHRLRGYRNMSVASSGHHSRGNHPSEIII